MLLTQTMIQKTNIRIMDSFSNQTFNFKASQIESWFNERINELRIITYHSGLEDRNIEDMIAYIEVLNQNVGTRFGNEWGTFAIGYTDGIGYVSKNVTIDISEREYFKEAMNSDEEYVLSSPVNSRTDNEMISLICYPLRDNGEIYGFINGAINLKELSSIVDEIDLYDGVSWMMDSEGVIYTNDNVSDDVIAKILPLVNNGQNTNNYHDKDNVVFFTKIKQTDLFLCTSIQNSILFKDTNVMRNNIIVISLVVFVLVIMIANYLSKSITKPLIHLEKAMKEVEEGNFEVNVDIRDTKELSILASAFNKMVSRIKELMDIVKKDEKDKRESELKILQAQINPHFLYNTLDTLSFKALDNDDEEMVKMIDALSNFFRISLSKGKEFIPLTKEIEHLESYLYIQKIRFKDILTYSIDNSVDEELVVLKLILQPIVENAILHGIKPKGSKGYVNVEVSKTDKYLYYKIRDNGVGMSEDKLADIRLQISNQKPATSYGLINVSNRIKLTYGKEANLMVDSTYGVGTTIVVSIPLQGENDD